MAESTSSKRQHEENKPESEDEFVGPLPAEAIQTKAKKKKGLRVTKILFQMIFLLTDISGENF